MLARATLVYYSKNCSLFEWIALLLLAIFAFVFTNKIFDYGTFGIIIALWGYNYRHKIGNQLLQAMLMWFAIIITQIMLFNFLSYNLIILIMLTTVTVYLLNNFTVRKYDFNSVNRYVINIAARYSLYLYCLHLLVILVVKNSFS